MNFEFSPMGKLIGYTVGFVAGICSLLLGRPVVSDLFGFMLLWIWYGIIATSIVANAWGMLHQAELRQTCSESETK